MQTYADCDVIAAICLYARPSETLPHMCQNG